MFLPSIRATGVLGFRFKVYDLMRFRDGGCDMHAVLMPNRNLRSFFVTIHCHRTRLYSQQSPLFWEGMQKSGKRL